MSEKLAVGTKVVTRLESPGIDQDGYGWLPRLARGNVVAHTQDGRPVIDFPGYGAHTWHDTALLDVIEVVPDELASLRAALAAANERIATRDTELACANGRIRELEAAREWQPLGEWASICCDCDGECGAHLNVDDGDKLTFDAPDKIFVLPSFIRLHIRRPQARETES